MGGRKMDVDSAIHSILGSSAPDTRSAHAPPKPAASANHAMPGNVAMPLQYQQQMMYSQQQQQQMMMMQQPQHNVHFHQSSVPLNQQQQLLLQQQQQQQPQQNQGVPLDDDFDDFKSAPVAHFPSSTHTVATATTAAPVTKQAAVTAPVTQTSLANQNEDDFADFQMAPKAVNTNPVTVPPANPVTLPPANPMTVPPANHVTVPPANHTVVNKETSPQPVDKSKGNALLFRLLAAKWLRHLNCTALFGLTGCTYTQIHVHNIYYAYSVKYIHVLLFTILPLVSDLVNMMKKFSDFSTANEPRNLKFKPSVKDIHVTQVKADTFQPSRRARQWSYSEQEQLSDLFTLPPTAVEPAATAAVQSGAVARS